MTEFQCYSSCSTSALKSRFLRFYKQILPSLNYYQCKNSWNNQRYLPKVGVGGIMRQNQVCLIKYLNPEFTFISKLHFIITGMLTKSCATILLATGAKPSGNSYSSFSIFWNIMYSLLRGQNKQICNTHTLTDQFWGGGEKKGQLLS